MEQIEFRAMGCEVFIAVDVTTRSIRTQLLEVAERFARWEECLSRFRPESELSRLNERSGYAVAVSETLWSVVEYAQRAVKMSDGLVQPLLLNALEAAGYDRSFEYLKGHALPAAPSKCAQPLARGSIPLLEMDPRTRTIILPRGWRLDLGGIAKGWAAEQAAQLLGAYGPTLVDVGGDMVISAPRANGEPWPIGIANPFADEEDDSMPLLEIERGAVATSGRDYRHWLQHGRKQHHIIDPRTGEPAVTDVLTATVVAPTALEAEVAAKVAFILGSEAGVAWIDARPSLAALLILENGHVIESQRLRDFCWNASESRPGTDMSPTRLYYSPLCPYAVRL